MCGNKILIKLLEDAKSAQLSPSIALKKSQVVEKIYD
jgi:hypothetical protein